MDISNYNIEQCDAVSVLNTIMDMHDHPQKIDQIAAAISPIAAAAAAYSEGKPQLAQAITAKGVTTAADASLATMAQNVGAIVQSTTILQGGEMYAKQLFGALEAPCFWNLYDVLVNIMSYNANSFSGSPYTALQGHQFGGIMLCEFPKGDATTSLSDFPLTGGGYIMSDGAAYYNEAPTHTWNDDLDGKGNRWIALLMATEGGNFTIASAAVCPSSIYIGGKVGTITYGGTSAGKISEIVVPDGNELGGFVSGNYAQAWGSSIIIRNVKTHNSGNLLYNIPTSVNKVYIEVEDFKDGVLIQYPDSLVQSQLHYLIVDCKYSYKNTANNLPKGTLFGTGRSGGTTALTDIIIRNTEGYIGLTQYQTGDFAFRWIKNIIFDNIEELTVFFNPYSNSQINSDWKLYINYATNNKAKALDFVYRNTNPWQKCGDVLLKNGWCKPINLRYFTGLTKQNVADHIFAKLGVNDLSTGAVTITLATAVLNLFTQEEIDVVVARTNITIVGA